MTSFGRQFDFHDVIYHIQHCNVDNRRRNVVLTIMDFENVRKMCVTVQTRFAGNSNDLIKMAESLQTFKNSFIFSFFCE